jgi:predicted Rossmann-fold nucleotide-binding protein
LRLQAKPVGVLNVAGYFDALLRFLEHSAGEGFIRRTDWDLLVVEDAPALLFERLQRHAATVARTHPARSGSALG